MADAGQRSVASEVIRATSEAMRTAVFDVEAKEGLDRQPDGQIPGSIPLQHFLKATHDCVG
jgi:hypothetical protein